MRGTDWTPEGLRAFVEKMAEHHDAGRLPFALHLPGGNEEQLIDGKNILTNDPSNIIQAGVGRIPEDRHKDGIVGPMSVAENMIIEDLNNGKIQSRGLLNNEAIMRHCSDLSSKYDVRGPGPNTSARLLSGGNIQKLILARVFEASPKLILANQPTRG